jgi:hypothetical protein
MPVMQIRGSFLGAALALVSLGSPPARAQTLLDVMGAGAIQNSLQSLPAGGASGVIERSRSVVEQANQAEQQRLDLLQQMVGGGGAPVAPGAAAALMAPLMAPLMEMVRAAGVPVPAGAGPRPLSTAQVNGRLVPYCSHGGLCHGSLLRAVRGY